MAIIEIKDLGFSYPETSARAIDGVSLSIERGEFVAVLGHNGSGKSTLAKHLNAILQPGAGSVLIDGMDTRELSRLHDIRKKAGMVFQNPDNQIVATVVEEDVAFACENLGLPSDEIRRRVDAALACVGMSEYAAHAPHLLSGGQKQRVAIAGVLAIEPEIIVLDEPTAMLDPSGRKEVLAALRRLNRDKGMTVVLITHHMDEAADAGRVIVMSEGKIALDGPPRKVFADVARVRALSLDVPQTADLLNRLGLPPECSGVDECADIILNYLRDKRG